MITEKDLHEAIAECQGQRNPNANTCIKLASFYTILDHLNKSEEARSSEMPNYSFSAAPGMEYESDTDFGQKIANMDINDILAIMDELMTTLSAVNPRLYAAVMRKL